MFIIGITGSVGSGKSTLANKIQSIFGDVSIIQMDNYFMPYDNLTLEERKKINFDNPKTYDIKLLLQHINLLKQNKSIEMPIYSHKDYERLSETKTITAKRVLIIEGFACLYFKKLRDLLDFSLFVDIDEVTQIKRLIDRDVTDKQRNLNTVLNQFLKTIQVSNNKYCEPQKKYASMIVNGMAKL